MSFYEGNDGELRWVNSGLPLDPSDIPHPEDPPIDSLSMMEVAAEVRQRAIETRAAALRVMTGHALIAIGRGEDPHKVAEACGWKIDDERWKPVLLNTPWGRLTVDQAMQYGMQIEQPDPMEQFVNWLCDGVRSLIQEQVT